MRHERGCGFRVSGAVISDVSSPRCLCTNSGRESPMCQRSITTGNMGIYSPRL